MMDWSKRGGINTAALVTTVMCNTLVVWYSRQLIGPADWVLSQCDLYTVLSLEAVAYSSYYNVVEWFWFDLSLFQWPAGFLQCFDTVGWVFWLSKSSPKWPIKCWVGREASTHAVYLLVPAVNCLCQCSLSCVEWDMKLLSLNHCCVFITQLPRCYLAIYIYIYIYIYILHCRCSSLMLSVNHLAMLAKTASSLTGVLDWVDQSLADVEEHLTVEHFSILM